MNKCLQCGKETSNPKFCSRGCAGIYISKLLPKRIKTAHYCKVCGKEIQKYGAYYRKTCLTCKTEREKYIDSIYTFE